MGIALPALAVDVILCQLSEAGIYDGRGQRSLPPYPQPGRTPGAVPGFPAWKELSAHTCAVNKGGRETSQVELL